MNNQSERGGQSRPEDAEPSLLVEPAELPTGLGQDAKYCPLCPGWYRLKDIKAIASDGTTAPATKILLPVTSRQKRTGLLRREREKITLTRAQRAEIVAKNYTLECPRGHNLINTLGPTDVVGIIGNVNSSKSHYLTGLVYELIHEQRLAAFGADVGYIGDTGTVMDERIDAVYRRGEILPNNEPKLIDGPFSYKLTRHVGTAAESKSTLTFFDVAGEDCVGLARSAEFVRYLFNATGIVVLIDPGGLPFPGRPLEPRGEVALTSRAIIDNLADAMEAVTGVPSREQPQVISIAVSKADIADLPSEVWPPDIWPPSSGKPESASAIRTRLQNYSDQCKKGFMDIGGQSIIRAAETRFNSRNLYYSAVSATNQIPLEGRWCGPNPVGCSVALAQILWFTNNL
jgi:hypothetical protein